ncbi:MAG: hypothetical protein DRJ11_01405 [Candidatus Aminicenantes bacterium]|nr:MAG: hypothetical protein DRJ11_01405 [Candidatus Aminicenantes bacterium]
MRTKEKHWLLVVLPFFLFMVTPEGGQHSASGSVMLGKVLNFIVLFGGLGWLLRKAIRDFLTARGQQVQQELAEAAREKQVWLEKQSEINTRLAKLDEELARIREESLRQAEKRKKEIMELAQQEAERIKALTRREIEWLYQRNVFKLREYAAAMAVKLARQKIKEALSSERHHQLVAKSINNLDKLYEKFVAR